jgi:hypothetical protein
MIKVNHTYLDRRGFRILITGVEMYDKDYIGMELEGEGFIRQYRADGYCTIENNGLHINCYRKGREIRCKPYLHLRCYRDKP